MSVFGYNEVMVLPRFPNFKEIDISMKDTVKGFLSEFSLEASEYTFTNMFAFKLTYDFRVSLLKDNLIILREAEPVSAFCPVGNSVTTEVLDEIFYYLKKNNSKPCLERVPESFVKAYLNENSKYTAEEERDHFDYVYDAKELIELKGRKYHDKKNRVNKFRSSYKYEYQTLTPDLIDECLEFEDYWCEVKECEKYYGLNRERCAVLAMLNNFRDLDIKGGLIRIEDRIAALALGERFLSDTFVIHAEKANPDIPGLYQIINQEFLMHEAVDCRFVNREQDLGIQGLRNAKLSYNPVRFIKKYRIQEKDLP
jgi:hypothetical protein